MLLQEAAPLESVSSFNGAGIYAIYYAGDFAPYSAIAERNREGKFEAPIYVGKAIPAGARKGNVGLDVPTGPVLTKRLKEHADSINIASNLDLADFWCRYLVVDDIWIPLGESLLIARYSPIWNKYIDGFGNHDPGKGRYQQLRSLWDVLHPGRPWAEKCQGRKETQEQIAEDVRAYLSNI
ncbi:MAG: restriction endonuclease [Rhodospirillaceae bacterium]|nr:restriction endonuclease [Magnetovibrio sp.]MAY65915.1 restriction endonuclease [Rhodospirillaceae bacterium]